MSFHHQMRVRYSECDQQGVVFNAHYMAFMDDATDVWVRSVLQADEELAWEWMVVRASINWNAPARCGDLLDIEVGMLRYGNTSFDFGFIATVEGKPIFRGRTICVSINPKTLEKVVVPEHVRPLLGEPVDWDIPE